MRVKLTAFPLALLDGMPARPFFALPAAEAASDTAAFPAVRTGQIT